MIRQEIIKQYVSSLKEDGELDYIFPLLLQRMNYRVLSTPRQSKGRSQYGRDVVAIKKIKDVETLFFFELKGFTAKDITDRNLNEKDGLIESLRASKYTEYSDASIPGLKKYPRQYVFVHNGYLEENARPTLDGFIKQEFPGGNFDRWDLDKLTSLFSEYLFDETLLADEESYRLFKKVLVLLDAEENDFSDLKRLVELQISKIESVGRENTRTILNFFATLKLIASMVYFYSKDSDNLYPAKVCIDTIVLKTWAYILRGRKERRPTYMKHFNSLVLLQTQIYEDYVNKILQLLPLPKCLYAFQGTETEYVFYPLRCYDYLGDLIYFFVLTESYSHISKQESRKRMGILKHLVRNNSGCTVPLLDTHSIPILMFFKYIYLHANCDDDYHCLGDFLIDTVLNMCKRYSKQQMWPEMMGNRMALAKSLYMKSDDYSCGSSLLIVTLFELISYMNISELYNAFKKVVEESKVNLQVAYPIQEEYDIEPLLFEKRLNDELSVETNLKLPDSIEDFQKTFRKKYKSIKYRTDKVNYGFLRLLAHKYYETDMFPDFLGRDYCWD